MRIYVLSQMLPPKPGGAGKRALRNAEELSKKNEVNLISRTRNTNTKLTVHQVGVDFKTASKLLYYFEIFCIFPFYVLKNLFLLKRPDILHCYSVNWLGIYYYFVSKYIWKVPITYEITLYGSDTPNSQKKWWLYRKLSDYCIHNSDCLFCNSEQLFNYLKMKTDRKVILVNNPVDTEKFRAVSEEKKLDLRTKYGFNKNDIILVKTAHINKRKGYDSLVKAFVSLLKADKKYKLVCIGRNIKPYQVEMMNYMQEVLMSENLPSENLVFTGFTDPAPYLQLSDIFLFSSTREGMPSAILEAMSCELPVICRSIEGVTDKICNHKNNAFICRSDEEGFIEDAIRFVSKLGNDHSKRIDLGQNGREFIIQHHSLDKVANQYEQIFEKLINRNL